MSKRQRLNYTRYRMISLGLRAVVRDHEEDLLLVTNLRRRSPGQWMSPFLYARTDETQCNTLAKLEMDFIQLGCISEFFKTTRMPPRVHKELLDLVTPLIAHRDTNFRPAISPAERLSITIRYLARGKFKLDVLPSRQWNMYFMHITRDSNKDEQANTQTAEGIDTDCTVRTAD